MVFNRSKTECMVMVTAMRQKHQLVPLTLNLTVQNHPVVQIKELHLLGVTTDDQFKWQSHIINICTTVSRNLFLLSKLKHFIDSVHKLFYNVHNY